MFINKVNTIKKELERVSPILDDIGFFVDSKQIHIQGERVVLGSKKLVLFCTKKDTGEKVVVKCSRFKVGKKEIIQERKMREHSKNAKCAKGSLSLPEEVYYGKKKGMLFFITLYIPQDKVFVEHDIKKQFFMAIQSLETQESFHVTTYGHIKEVRKVSHVLNSKEYIKMTDKFIKNIEKNYKNLETLNLTKEVRKILSENRNIIDRYCYHLIHEDFVPHNFRIDNDHIYILDYSSLQYGNRYESWARFLNYMLIHNPELEEKLSNFVLEKRGKDEFLSLGIMRMFKIVLLIDFYSSILDKTDGNLLKLTKIRIAFWTKVLGKLLKNEIISKGNIKDYKNKRDALRSKEEKERQREFAVA